MNLIPDSTLTCLKRGTPAKAPSGTLLSGLRLRIEVPLWRDLTAKHPTADLPAEEDSASDATGSAERSPRLALPVPVGFPVPSSLSFFFHEYGRRVGMVPRSSLKEGKSVGWWRK